jgi:Protein of unknown function (DUF4232)
MDETQVLRTRSRRIAGAATLSAAAALAVAAVAGTAGAASAAEAGRVQAPATAPACGNSSLRTTEGEGGAAMMHEGVVLVFTNVSKHACTLYGYPGAAIEDKTSPLINAVRTLNGYIGDGGRTLTHVSPVTIDPGATASAEVEWVENAGQHCYRNGQGGLRVTPPNTTDTVSLGGSVLVGGQGICSGFKIHPVVPGTITNP